jgi:hypothetical protein
MQHGSCGFLDDPDHRFLDDPDQWKKSAARLDTKENRYLELRKGGRGCLGNECPCERRGRSYVCITS